MNESIHWWISQVIINSWIHELIQERRFWAVVGGKWITYYINRTDYPSGFSQQNLACSAFCVIGLACGAFWSIKNLAGSAFFWYKIFLLIILWCIRFQFAYFVYQFIGGENHSNINTESSNINTESSQWHNLYQTVMKKVSNNKPFVKSNVQVAWDWWLGHLPRSPGTGEGGVVELTNGC